MAVTFNESTVAATALSPGVARLRLLTEARVPGTKVFLDRLELAAGTAFEMCVSSEDLGWLQILEGGGSLRRADATDELTDSNIVFLPPGFRGTLSSADGVVLLYAEVPRAARFDARLAQNPPQFRVIDWKHEPVLDSRHDARKRIYLATPKLFDTRAIKGEMIIYPPGTRGSSHHHEGAEHFMYVLKGRGTAYANEQPIQVSQGDLIYYHERERHYLRSEGAQDMAFVEFFVPGEYRTVWADGAPACAWTPTGRDIRGDEPAREIQSHSSAAAIPQDV